MKKCPFCAEEIQDQAVKCKHCGEFLLQTLRTGGPKEKWYFRPYVLVIALLSVGPLGLPLLWVNPRYSRRSKIIWTVVVVVLTILLGKLMDYAVKNLLEYYRMAFGSLSSN